MISLYSYGKINEMQNSAEKRNEYICAHKYFVDESGDERCLYCARPKYATWKATSVTKQPETRLPLGEKALTSSQLYVTGLSQAFGYGVRQVYSRKEETFRIRIDSITSEVIEYVYSVVGGLQRIPLPKGTKEFTSPICSGLDTSQIRIIEARLDLQHPYVNVNAGLACSGRFAQICGFL